MNYEKLIKQAKEKRELNSIIKAQEQEKELTHYLEEIKLLKLKIKELLKVERLLINNGFAYNELCTDSWAHKVGFALGKNAIGVYGGGACGEFDLLVSEQGVALMRGCKGTREPNYNDLWSLKRFVNDFEEFEFRVKQFVKSL